MPNTAQYRTVLRRAGERHTARASPERADARSGRATAERKPVMQGFAIGFACGIMFMGVGIAVGIRRTRGLVRERLKKLIRNGRIQVQSDGREVQIEELAGLIIQ